MTHPPAHLQPKQIHHLYDLEALVAEVVLLASNSDKKGLRTVWDFDGTIVDSEAIHEHSYRTMLESAGYHPPEGFFDRLIGHNEAQIWELLREEYQFPETVQMMEERSKSLLPKLVNHPPNIFVRPLLHMLAAYNVPSIIISNGQEDTINGYLEQWHLHDKFTLVSGAGDASKATRLETALATYPSFLLEDSATYIHNFADITLSSLQIIHRFNRRDVTLADAVLDIATFQAG